MRRLLAGGVLLLGMAAAAGLGARIWQSDPAPPTTLPALARQLPSSQQQALQARQRHWQSLDAAARGALQQRHQQWQALAPARRRELLDAWQASRLLTPAERAAMAEAASHWRSLPAEAQQALRAQFDAQDVHQRRGWLLGPELGRDWPALQPLFAFVPASQREPLLRILRQMSAEQRAELGVLAQRVPPQERAALRQELLQTPAAQRAQWLRARLGG